MIAPETTHAPRGAAAVAARLGITEGQAYTLAIGLVLGLILVAVSLPNLHRGGAVLGTFAVADLDPGPDVRDLDDAGDVVPPPVVAPASTMIAEPATTTTTTTTAPSTAIAVVTLPAASAPPAPPHAEEPIPVGFLIDTAGFAAATDPTQAAVDAVDAVSFWIGHFNERGGVAGRRLRARVVTFDGRDPESSAGACEAVTVDRPSVWVSVRGGAVARCVATERNTLTLARDGLDAAAYDTPRPRLFSWGMQTSRLVAAQVDLLDEAGELDGATIGVVYGWDPVLVATVDDALLPALEARGYEVAAAYQFNGSESDADLVVAAANMVVNGVDLVVHVAPVDWSVRWAAAADQVRWSPTQVLSDVGGGVLLDSAGYPESFVGHGHSAAVGQHDRNAGTGTGRVPAVEADCRRRYSNATGTDVVAPTERSTPDDVIADRSLVEPCRDLALMAEVATAVGIDADALAASLTTLEGLDVWANPPDASFAAGGDAPQHLRPVRWERPCPGGPDPSTGCWTAAGAFRAVPVRP